MPNHIKAIISLLVALAAGGFFWQQQEAGQAVTPWVGIALAAFMIGAVWLFPEAKGRKGRGEG